MVLVSPTTAPKNIHFIENRFQVFMLIAQILRIPSVQFGGYIQLGMTFTGSIGPNSSNSGSPLLVFPISHFIKKMVWMGTIDHIVVRWFHCIGIDCFNGFSQAHAIGMLAVSFHTKGNYSR